MSMTAMAPGVAPNLDLRRPGLLGALGLLLLVGVLGTWAATTVIGGAVIASGQAVVHGKPKLVQSLDGGTVAEIRVQNGDVVVAGDILLRLDPTILAVNLDIARSRLGANLALAERLRAEQLGLAAPEFRYPSLPFATPVTAPHEASERAIFAARAAVLTGARAQLAESLRQADRQAEGVAGQIAALDDQIAILDRDLTNMQSLIASGLARQSQMSDLQRNRSQLLGQLSALQSELARIDTGRRTAELTTLQAERSFMEEVVTQLREATSLTEELILEIVTRQAQLDRIEIRAPASGIVHEVQVSTLGGVIAPGATILEVIPLDEGMDFELRVDPRAIDQVYPGQGAQVVMASFDPQTTPRLAAEVTTVSPDVITDPLTGQQFYRVGLAVPPEELARLGDVALMPGMPVEGYLETGDRTILTYLLHPVTAHVQRAFRE
jgi:HlyD family secretion protein